jgi:hypothetical protein
VRYLHSSRALREAFEIGLATGSLPPAFLRPHIASPTRLELEPSTKIACGNMGLLLAAHTASWCLLEHEEARVTDLLRNQVTFANLGRQFAAQLEDRLREFLVRLYQRGLLRIDGKPGLDSELLARGGLFSEKNLAEILVTQKCNLASLPASRKPTLKCCTFIPRLPSMLLTRPSACKATCLWRSNSQAVRPLSTLDFSRTSSHTSDTSARKPAVGWRS